MDSVYTALNFIPVLTLCAVVYAAGAFSQRVKEMEREIKRLRSRVHRLSNLMQKHMKGFEETEEEEPEEPQ